MQLRDWVEETATRLEERMATAEQRIDGCVAYTRWSATTPTARCRGSSRARWRCSTRRRTGVVVSSILHRDQARVYVKQMREGESELELSPEEQRGDRRPRMAGAPAARLMRVGYLGPGGHLQRGGAAGLRARRASRRCPTRPIYETVMAVQDGEVDRARRADRERARGRRGGHARRARAARPPTCASSPRWCTRSTTAWSRARELDARPTSTRVVSHPQATRPVRAASCASGCRGAERVVGAVHRRRRAPVRDAGEPCGRARLAPGGRALRLPGAGRGRRGPPRQRDALRLAGAGRRGAGTPGPAAKTSIVFWGVGDESPGWLVDVLREFAGPRREPDPDRVAAAADVARPLHVLRRPRGRRGRAARRRGARRAARAGRGAAGSRLVHECERGCPAKLGGAVAVSTDRCS